MVCEYTMKDGKTRSLGLPGAHRDSHKGSSLSVAPRGAVKPCSCAPSSKGPQQAPCVPVGLGPNSALAQHPHWFCRAGGELEGAAAALPSPTPQPAAPTHGLQHLSCFWLPTGGVPALTEVSLSHWPTSYRCLPPRVSATV